MNLIRYIRTARQVYDDYLEPGWRVTNGRPQDKTVVITFGSLSQDTVALTASLSVLLYSKEIDLRAVHRAYQFCSNAIVPGVSFETDLARNNRVINYEGILGGLHVYRVSIESTAPVAAVVEGNYITSNYVYILGSDFATVGADYDIWDGTLANTEAADGTTFDFGRKTNGGRIDLTFGFSADPAIAEFSEVVFKVKTPVDVDIYLSTDGSPAATIPAGADFQDVTIAIGANGLSDWTTYTTGGTVDFSVWFWTDNPVAEGTKIELDLLGLTAV